MVAGLTMLGQSACHRRVPVPFPSQQAVKHMGHFRHICLLPLAFSVPGSIMRDPPISSCNCWGLDFLSRLVGDECSAEGGVYDLREQFDRYRI